MSPLLQATQECAYGGRHTSPLDCFSGPVYEHGFPQPASYPKPLTKATLISPVMKITHPLKERQAGGLSGKKEKKEGEVLPRQPVTRQQARHSSPLTLHQWHYSIPHHLTHISDCKCGIEKLMSD